MLLLNVAIILFIALSKPRHNGHHPNRMGPPPMLNLTASQAKHFKLLADQHKVEMQDIKAQQKVILNQHFSTLYKTDLSLKNYDLAIFYDLEKQKINSTYSHFTQVKELLNNEQMQNFREFIEQTLGFIHGGGKGNHPPK